MAAVGLEGVYVNRHLRKSENLQSHFTDEYKWRPRVDPFRNKHVYESIKSLTDHKVITSGEHRMHPIADPSCPKRDVDKEYSSAFSLDCRVLQPLKGHAPPPESPSAVTAKEVYFRLHPKKPTLFKFSSDDIQHRLKGMSCMKSLPPDLVKQTHQVLCNEEDVNQHVHNILNKSVRQMTENDAAIPLNPLQPKASLNTLEKRADMLSHTPARYAPQTHIWQRCFDQWDWVQLRYPIDDVRKRPIEGTQPRTFLAPIKERMKPVYPPCNDKAAQAVRAGLLHHNFERPLPNSGYHIPVDSLVAEMDVKGPPKYPWVSVNMESYGVKPLFQKDLENRHKAPLGKTATIVCPYNAFSGQHKCGEPVSYK